MPKLAIIAGRGQLPEEVYLRVPDAIVVSFQSVGIDFECDELVIAEFEKFGGLVKTLRAKGVTRVCFAGAMTRPEFNLRRLDAKTLILLPKIKRALVESDGGTLSFVRRLFEDEGFEIVGAHDVAPALLMSQGQMTTTAPGSKDIESLERANAILDALGALDIGQGVVMREGQCLATETLPGTNAMLAFCAQHSDSSKQLSGFLLKASKRNQDLDIDMPTIGPETIEAAYHARLNGLFLEAGRVIVLNKDEVKKRADVYGMFVEGLVL